MGRLASTLFLALGLAAAALLTGGADHPASAWTIAPDGAATTAPAPDLIGAESDAQSATGPTLAGRGVHSLGRYGSWTYCSIEDNMIEARALADALSGG